MASDLTGRPEHSDTQAEYRPLSSRSDIDGLRAVAVLGVLVFHAFSDLLPGGFWGFAVFLVISGFLISRIIWDGILGPRFIKGELCG